MNPATASRTLAGLLAALTIANAPALHAEDTTSPAVGKESIADFVRAPDVSDVTFSPDGKYLAAIVPDPRSPYENYLAVLDGKTGAPLQALRAGNRTMVAAYTWGEHDRLFLSPAVRRRALDTPEMTGELIGIDPDGTHGAVLFGMRAGGMHAAGKVGSLTAGSLKRQANAMPLAVESVGEDEILVAVFDYTSGHTGTIGASRAGAFTDIEKLNAHSGAATLLGQSPVRNAWLTADHAAQVRVATANGDFKGEQLWTRANNDATWQRVNDAAQSHVEILPIGFNRDNNKLYVRVRQGSQPDSIELMDMQTQQRTRLYQGTFADPGELLRSSDNQDFYAVITHDGRDGLHYFNEESDEAKLNKQIAASFPGQLVYFSSFSRDGQHAVVRVMSDRNPGDYLLFDRSTHTASFLMHAEPWIHPGQMRPKEPIELKARDGLVLHGFLTTPEGKQPFPLVLLPHGGPYGVSDGWDFDPEVQLLASRGYAVLQVNYRGSGGYGAQFQTMGYKQWGLSMQDDLTDATRWAVAQGYADAQRMCIYGASYGGYAALEAAVRTPDMYRCAAGLAGVYDMRVQLDDGDGPGTDFGDAYLAAVLGTDRDDLLKRSPLSGAAQIKSDLLLMHGEEDNRVPFKNFQEFTKALDQHGKHYDTLVEPEEGHGFFLPAHREAGYQKLLDFLARNIGTPTTPVAEGTPTARVNQGP
ncbi:alpha/beta hydrolase family protein [Dyella amyloliquefaciens]|uniref:alpha/beta hydrolase family protein n=1 Tax=Dyella amyloliquefaciens TaxID=1770545 RepID=UPI00102E9DB2|nr:S9 family peptidase [Dyella amyloliquefaciens]